MRTGTWTYLRDPTLAGPQLCWNEHCFMFHLSLCNCASMFSYKLLQGEQSTKGIMYAVKIFTGNTKFLSKITESIYTPTNSVNVCFPLILLLSLESKC